MQQLVRELDPAVVIVDPISNLVAAGSEEHARSMITRLIDFLKSRGITALLTNLSSRDGLEQTELNVSSVADTWLLLRDIETNGERNRILYVLKSRGMAHSNQLREFLITDQGVDLVDVYVDADGVLTGSARAARQEAAEAARLAREQDAGRRRRELDRKRRALEHRIRALEAEFEEEVESFEDQLSEEEGRARSAAESRRQLAHRRGRAR